MTEATETVEKVYTAQENRRYARRLLIGKSGLTKAEKVERMEKAQAALALAIEQTKAAEEFVPQADVENYDADEAEAYSASF